MPMSFQERRQAIAQALGVPVSEVEPAAGQFLADWMARKHVIVRERWADCAGNGIAQLWRIGSRLYSQSFVNGEIEREDDLEYDQAHKRLYHSDS
jgi:hypothetical protein